MRSSRSERRSSKGSETALRTRRDVASRPRCEVRVRRARSADIPAILDLWRELLAFHRDIGETDMRLGRAVIGDGLEFFEGHIGKRDQLCLVAELRGKAVGFLVATLRRRSPAFGGWRYGHIYDLYVQEPQSRPRRGSGPRGGSFPLVPKTRRPPRAALGPRAQHSRDRLLEGARVFDARVDDGEDDLRVSPPLRLPGTAPTQGHGRIAPSKAESIMAFRPIHPAWRRGAREKFGQFRISRLHRLHLRRGAPDAP